MTSSITITVPDACSGELRDIFSRLADAIPQDPAFASLHEEEKQKVLEHELFLHIGKKLIQHNGQSCYDLVGPLFQAELHQEFRHQLDALHATSPEQLGGGVGATVEDGEDGADEVGDGDAGRMEAAVVEAVEEDEGLGAVAEADPMEESMRARQTIYAQQSYALLMKNDDLRPNYCAAGARSKRQQRQREEYAGVGLKRLGGNMEGVKKEFYRLFSHFALESKAIYPELFLFQDEDELKAKMIQPTFSILMGTMLRFRGDVTRVTDPAYGVLVYADEYALYNALEILVNKSPNLRKADCYIVKIDDPNAAAKGRAAGTGGNGGSPFGQESSILAGESTDNLSKLDGPGSFMTTSKGSGPLGGGDSKSYGTLSKMRKEHGLVRNPMHKSQAGVGATDAPHPTKSQLDSTYANMEVSQEDPGGMGGDGIDGAASQYSGSSTSQQLKTYDVVGATATGNPPLTEMQPVSVHLCISAHIVRLQLYTERSYLKLNAQEQKKKFEELLIMAGTINDEVLVMQTLETIHNMWGDGVAENAAGGGAKGSAAGNKAPASVAATATASVSGGSSSSSAAASNSAESANARAPTVVHQVAANGNTELLASMFAKYPSFMSSMLVTPDNGGALPFQTAIYQQKLKTAVLLLRALAELVKHHANEITNGNSSPDSGAETALSPVLKTLVGFYVQSQRMQSQGSSLSGAMSPGGGRTKNSIATNSSSATDGSSSSAVTNMVGDPCGVLPEFWYCADYVLDKLAQGTFPLVPLEEEESAHTARLQQLQELWTLLGALGFGTSPLNDRVSQAIGLEQLQLCTFLSLIKARDSNRRTALMCACKMKTAIHEGMVKFILEKVPDCEVNATDQWNKSAVDYVMESSSTSSAKLLLDYGAKDAQGQDVLLRATLENNAHVVQFLLSYATSSGAANDSDAAGWAAGQNLWMLRRGAQAQGTFCTCFIPAQCQELRVRYPLIFGRTFPHIKALVRDPNAGKVLEDYRNLCDRVHQEELEKSGKNIGLIPVPKNPKGESLGALTGLDGLDTYMGRVQCWICKKTHCGSESWIGPVALQLKFEMEDDEEKSPTAAQGSFGRPGGSPALEPAVAKKAESTSTRPKSRGDRDEKGSLSPKRGGKGPEEDSGPPVLRLFMHHACCVGLEQHLKEEAARKEARENKRPSRDGIPKPRARSLLKDAKDFEHEFRDVPAAARTWKTSRGLENVGVKPPSYSGAGDNLGSLKKGEYHIR
eukprot:g5502.t1